MPTHLPRTHRLRPRRAEARRETARTRRSSSRKGRSDPRGKSPQRTPARPARDRRPCARAPRKLRRNGSVARTEAPPSSQRAWFRRYPADRRAPPPTRARFVRVRKATDDAGGTRPLLEQAAEPSMGAANARLHMGWGEIRQVHRMGLFVVGSLLRRYELGVVERGVEPRRLLTCRARGLAGVEGELHVERTGRLLVRLEIMTADAAARRRAPQREGLAAHVEADLLPTRAIVQEKERTLLVAPCPAMTKRLPCSSKPMSSHPYRLKCPEARQGDSRHRSFSR